MRGELLEVLPDTTGSSHFSPTPHLRGRGRPGLRLGQTWILASSYANTHSCVPRDKSPSLSETRILCC